MSQTTVESLEAFMQELLARPTTASAGNDHIPAHLQLFVQQAGGVLEKVRRLTDAGALSAAQAVEFRRLLVDVGTRILFHPAIAGNNYLQRFALGVTESQARHECQQFSVFALQFDVAQAKLVANAPTEEAYRERLHVLLNEKGIPYQSGFEGELTRRWSPQTVHFTWMLNMARGLGLEFEDVGKIWLAQPGTRAFVDATFENYASIEPNVSAGASFAIENWAANALWNPWIDAMEKLNARREERVDLGYLKYHAIEEQHHSQATLDELLDNVTEPWFDAEQFLDAAEQMLSDGVEAYYVSQLDSLPEKDDTWPKTACDTLQIDPNLPIPTTPADRP